MEQGDTSKEDIAMLGQLRDLRGSFKTGGPAALQNWLADQGIKVGKNVDEIQAYNAIINKMTPSQRVPGSGATSDYEDKLFKSGLPRLINQPGGNDFIENTLVGIAQHRMARAEIASRATAGEISHKDARDQMEALPSPFARVKALAQNGWKLDNPNATPGPNDTPAQPGPPKFTPEEISQSIANAKAKIASVPGSRQVVIDKLRAAGIDPTGL
jgi:hypothetical protein